MQNDQTYSEIKGLVQTREDYIHLLDELDILKRGVYETGDNGFEKVIAKADKKLSELILRCIREGSDREKVLKEIEEKIQEIEFVEITFSSNPSQNTIDEVLTWVSENMHQKVAIDFKVDRGLIGGVTLAYKGKYFDGSVRKILEGIMAKYV